MRYALYIVGFTFAQVVATGACVAFVLSHFDHGTKGETVVVAVPPVAAPRPPVVAEVGPARTIGGIVLDNERPIVPTGWKAGKPEVVGRVTCTPVVGPNGEQVVVFECDAAVDAEAAMTEIAQGMEAGGWKKQEFGSWWKGGQEVLFERTWGRNRLTYVCGKGSSRTAAQKYIDAFLRN